uniref:Uncharacterized protein n=1 Tax=Lactuca sativa TaxID=4236 RepID=A0A9R1VZ08_LACSA|nr:hypothetical protein LSAT_V11C300144350 [Lactuca sativa]
MQVSAYLLGEYSHLLARRPGCSPKDIFVIIHEKLPTVSTPTISILLSTYAKILMHSQPPDPKLQNQIWAIFSKYETCIDTEIQQRAVEYFALSRKGEALMDILAEMPKFPEREKAEDTEVDTAELSAIKSRTQHQASNALVVISERQHPQLGMVKIPSVDHNSVSVDQELTQANGISHEVDHPQPDILGDLLSPLVIEAPPPPVSEDDALALAPVEEQDNIVKVLLSATCPILIGYKYHLFLYIILTFC